MPPKRKPEGGNAATSDSNNSDASLGLKDVDDNTLAQIKADISKKLSDSFNLEGADFIVE